MTPESLEVVRGALKGSTIRVGEEPFVIGRGESDLGKLGDDPEISRRHAQVSRRDGRLVVEDLGSTNGTLVNGRRISEPTPIAPGDTLEVGGTTLRVLAPEPDEPEAKPEPPTPDVLPLGGQRILLKVTDGPAAGGRIPLAGEPFVIGRGESGPGALGDDPELSRLHARVFLVGGRLAVEDLGSTNGTFVNGHRIVYPTMIGPGDELEAGGTKLEVLDSPAASS